MGRVSAAGGFTLVEMAVVMVVMGLIMLTVLPALSIMRGANERELTQSNLHSLIIATAAYVQANGCLPCPANPASGGTNFGVVGTGSACGTCMAPEGIPPFVSLGVPASVAHDGWHHWITMRVDPALTANFGIKPPTGSAGLCASGLSTTNRIAVTTPGGATQQAAVIFISHGKDGYGSFFAQASPSMNNGARLPFYGSYAACSVSSGYARCNADGNTQFYDATDTEGSDTYDDMLAYASRNALVATFGNASCQTTW
ncbi:MAG: prepilin-type N-terminal cleavage/methylation domain-containing protein [Alphaproteobacteria bacterium]|nr:prepilin-type N-terminal cleavage/methylation domain-containing protein [Alphaproteobacteria bacterium]